MIRLYSHGKRVTVSLRKFPAGETFIKLSEDDLHNGSSDIFINFYFESNSDLFDLALMVDAVRRRCGEKARITLHMPYLPYARQDRVMSAGESLSVKVVADFINSLNFVKVVCWNVHSDVGAALLDNFLHVPVTKLFEGHRFSTDNTILVSPDAGANKKVFDLALQQGFNTVVRADKTRDVKTGKISGTVVYSEHVGTKDFLIVDDICDGGRTFTELAKELRKLTDGKVLLYVTHGIFSAGAEVFDNLIDEIYVSNLVGNKADEVFKSSNKIKMLKEEA